MILFLDRLLRRGVYWATGYCVARVTYLSSVSKWNTIRKCSYPICPAATGQRIQISGKHPTAGYMNTEVNKRKHCGWNNWRKMSGIQCDKRVLPHVKGMIQKMIVQPAGDRASHYLPREETGSDRNEDAQMGMRPHAKRPCEKRKHQGETEGREYHREVQESKTEVVWRRKESRPGLRRKEDWRWYHPGGESKEDRSRDGWTVSTKT